MESNINELIELLEINFLCDTCVHDSVCKYKIDAIESIDKIRNISKPIVIEFETKCRYYETQPCFKKLGLHRIEKLTQDKEEVEQIKRGSIKPPSITTKPKCISFVQNETK